MKITLEYIIMEKQEKFNIHFVMTNQNVQTKRKDSRKNVIGRKTFSRNIIQNTDLSSLISLNLQVQR